MSMVHAEKTEVIWRTSKDYKRIDKFAYGYASLYFIDNIGSSEGYLVCVDVRTGARRWAIPWLLATMIARGPEIDLELGLLYLLDRQSLYAIDVHTGAVKWSMSPTTKMAELRLAGDLILVGTSDGQVLAINKQTREVQWSVQTEAELVGEFAVSNGIAYFLSIQFGSSTTFIFAMNVLNGSIVWKRAMNDGIQSCIRDGLDAGGGPEPARFIPGYEAPVLGMDKMYFYRSGVLRALHLGDGSDAWSMPVTSYVYPVVYDDYLVFSERTVLQMVRADTGHPAQAPIETGDWIGTGILVSEGVIYFGNYGETTGAVAAYDLGTGELLRESTPLPIRTIYPSLVNGVIYAAGGNRQVTEGDVSAVRFGEELKEFTVESALIQDYKTGSNTNHYATYQTHIKVLDDAQVPRAHQSVKVWATSAVNVSINDVEFEISANNPASVRTDSGGNLTVSTTANELSAPVLKLWTGFMDPDERIVVHMDRQFHQELTEIDGQRLIDAKSYNGTQLLPDHYRNEKTADHLASAIRSTMSMTNPPPGMRVRKSRKYIAFDDLVGVEHAHQDTPVSRDTIAVSARSYEFRFVEGTNDTVYRDLTSEEAQQIIDGFPAMLTLPTLRFSFHDFWDKIKRGLAKVVHIVISAAKDVANAINCAIKAVINGVEQVIKFVVHTVEEAAKLVASLFLSIGRALIEVVEALSVLFHWDEILHTRDYVKEKVSGFLNTDLQLQQYVGQARSFFQEERAAIHQALNSLKGQPEGNQTLDQMRGNKVSPHNTVFAANGKSHGVQCNWLLSKTSHHLGEARFRSGEAVLDDAGLLRDLEQLLDQIGDDIAHRLKSLLKDLENMLTASSFQSFLSQGLDLLIDILETLIDVALDIGETFVVGGLELFDQAFKALAGILNRKIEIPFVSDLYHFLTKDELTLLDLICLIVAVPTTVLYKALTGHFPSQRNSVGAEGSKLDIDQLILSIVFIVAAAGTALFDLGTILGWNEIFVGFMLTVLVLVVAARFFTLPKIPPDFNPGWITWIPPSLPVLVGLYRYYKIGAEYPPKAPGPITGCIGLLELSMFIYAGAKFSDRYGGINLVGNIFASLPNLAKFAMPWARTNEIAFGVVIGCDAGFLAKGIDNIANWYPDQHPS